MVVGLLENPIINRLFLLLKDRINDVKYVF